MACGHFGCVVRRGEIKMMKRTIALACGAALLACTAHAAEPDTGTAAVAADGISDPLAYVRSLYVGTGTAPASGDPYSADPNYSPRLRALFADNERYANGEIGRLDFNYMVGAQDEEITGLAVTAEEADGAADRKVITARFKNMGMPTAIHYYFERTGGRWLLDDVSSPGYAGSDGIGPWTLSLILRYGHR